MRLTELAADLEVLRADIAEELVAINRYEAQTHVLNDSELRDTLTHLLDEKKQHVARLFAQLRRLDPRQAEKLDHP